LLLQLLGGLVLVHQELRRLCTSLISSTDIASLPDGAEDSIPKGEEGLREIRLNAPALVMNIVVLGIVARQVLERIKGERVATVIVDGLDGGAGEEPHALACGHTGELVSERGAQRVQEEAFKGVVVECAVGIRNVQTVMTRMEGSYTDQLGLNSKTERET
jgi:hypothetical protein